MFSSCILKTAANSARYILEKFCNSPRTPCNQWGKNYIRNTVPVKDTCNETRVYNLMRTNKCTNILSYFKHLYGIQRQPVMRSSKPNQYQLRKRFQSFINPNTKHYGDLGQKKAYMNSNEQMYQRKLKYSVPCQFLQYHLHYQIVKIFPQRVIEQKFPYCQSQEQLQARLFIPANKPGQNFSMN